MKALSTRTYIALGLVSIVSSALHPANGTSARVQSSSLRDKSTLAADSVTRIGSLKNQATQAGQAAVGDAD